MKTLSFLRRFRRNFSSTITSLASLRLKYKITVKDLATCINVHLPLEYKVSSHQLREMEKGMNLPNARIMRFRMKALEKAFPTESFDFRFSDSPNNGFLIRVIKGKGKIAIFLLLLIIAAVWMYVHPESQILTISVLGGILTIYEFVSRRYPFK